jgi:predicted lipase
VHYAGASYCKPESLESWTCGEACSYDTSLTRVTPIINQKKGTYGFVGYNADDNQIIVSFRGASLKNIQNWITSIDFI